MDNIENVHWLFSALLSRAIQSATLISWQAFNSKLIESSKKSWPQQRQNQNDFLELKVFFLFQIGNPRYHVIRRPIFIELPRVPSSSQLEIIAQDSPLSGKSFLIVSITWKSWLLGLFSLPFFDGRKKRKNIFHCSIVKLLLEVGFQIYERMLFCHVAMMEDWNLWVEHKLKRWAVLNFSQKWWLL